MVITLVDVKLDKIAGAATVPPPAIVVDKYEVISFVTKLLDDVFCANVIIDFGGFDFPVNVNVTVHAEPLVIVAVTASKSAQLDGPSSPAQVL